MHEIHCLGGTFSGIPLNGSIFNSGEASAGNYQVIYTYTDINGCQNYTSQVFTVLPPLTITFINLKPSYCNTDPPVTLQAIPVGGVFSGPGISMQNTLYPGLAPEGVHTASYTYQDSTTGCSYTSQCMCSCYFVTKFQATFTIYSSPNVNLIVDNETCTDSPPFELIGLPSGTQNLHSIL